MQTLVVPIISDGMQEMSQERFIVELTLNFDASSIIRNSITIAPNTYTVVICDTDGEYNRTSVVQ